MDNKKSPSEDHNQPSAHSDHSSPHNDDDDKFDADMAVAVAQMPQPFAQQHPPPQATPVVHSNSTVNKRYRPAPAKTFQCRGYGECRMVFSRSEHLARHIRYALPRLGFLFLSRVRSTIRGRLRFICAPCGSTDVRPP